jgi:hypothetical protein
MCEGVNNPIFEQDASLVVEGLEVCLFSLHDF